MHFLLTNNHLAITILKIIIKFFYDKILAYNIFKNNSRIFKLILLLLSIL